MAKYWIKLHMDSLDDPKIACMSDHLWRRQVELFLLAGRHGDDGALPSVHDIAWKLHLSEDQTLEDLHALAEAGLVYQAQPGEWFVSDFKERQTSESYERVKRYRQRYSNVESNEASNKASNKDR